jgi:serine phosphatase RsbU (regulator of sigma subunit)/CheY-like chemotaxis protein/anti-sigma regulatory factor (Ser/Thr protein kinase)
VAASGPENRPGTNAGTSLAAEHDSEPPPPEIPAAAEDDSEPPAREVPAADGELSDAAAGEPAGELDHRAGILLVDDHRENLVALEAVLEPLGERMVSTESGEQALRALLRDDFAVILLDVRMAEMDGLETARIIRSRPRTRRIPIIFLTAQASDVEEIALAYATGAVDFVVKPFEPDTLRAKVSVFVELSHERAERVHQTRARAQAEAVAATVRKLQIVSDTALAHLELDELLAEILERASTLFDADAAGVLLLDDDGQELSRRAARGEPCLLEGDERITLGEGALGRLASESRPALLAAVELPPLPSGLFSPIDSLLVVPLRSSGEHLGLLYLGARPERRFGSEDLELLALAGERVAIAIDHAQRFAHGRELVEILQRSLLPERLPTHPRLELAARYLPSGLAAQVGGDWYDALVLGDERIGVMIGDIVGHGVRAATTMGELRNALRAFAIEGHTPGGALHQLDRVVHTTFGPGMVATVLFLIIDPGAGMVTLASAGHPPPALLGGDGRVRFLEPEPFPPLGVDGHAVALERSYPIAAGDTLLLFTDGLVERRREPIDVGLERLRGALSDGPGGVEELCDHVLERTLGDHPAQDDVAVLAVRLLAEPPGRLAMTLPATAESVPAARHRLRAWLATAAGEIDVVVARDLELVCSEACTNAVRHAYGPADATFSLQAEIVDADVVLEVRDHGRWREPRGGHGGRGLQLIHAVCDAVEIDRRTDGTRLRMRRSLGGDVAPSGVPATGAGSG